MNKRQKKKLIKIKNKKLIKRYPWLLPRSVWTDKVLDDYDYTFTLADEIPVGWRKAFFEEMQEEIRDELIRCNYLNEFRVLQIKEKYGRLAYYFGGVPLDCNVYDIVQKYEFLSEYICIECGALDVPNIPVVGWYSPICKCCYNEKIHRLDKWYTDHGYATYHYTNYEDLLKKVDFDYTLPLVIKNQRSTGQGWETVEIDISDTVNKLRNKYEKRNKRKA